MEKLFALIRNKPIGLYLEITHHPHTPGNHFSIASNTVSTDKLQTHTHAHTIHRNQSWCYTC